MLEIDTMLPIDHLPSWQNDLYQKQERIKQQLMERALLEYLNRYQL